MKLISKNLQVARISDVWQCRLINFQLVANNATDAVLEPFSQGVVNGPNHTVAPPESIQVRDGGLLVWIIVRLTAYTLWIGFLIKPLAWTGF